MNDTKAKRHRTQLAGLIAAPPNGDATALMSRLQSKKRIYPATFVIDLVGNSTLVRRASLATPQKLSPAFRKSARNDLIPKLFEKPCLAISLIDLSSHGIDRMYE